MTVARIAISLDANLARAVRKAAANETTSAWIADAIARKLRAEGLLRVVEAWESEHGAITAEELTKARRRVRGGKRR